MRRKCKFQIIDDYSENNEFKDGYLLGFSVDSKADFSAHINAAASFCSFFL